MILAHIKNRLLCALLLLGISMQNNAAMVIYPVHLYITGEKSQRTATLSIESSQDSHAVTYHAKTYRWEQDQNGNEILIPDSTLIVSPNSFVLHPKSTRTIRLGFKTAFSEMQLKQESAWRIIFTPSSQQEEKDGIEYLYSFNIPLFLGHKFSHNMVFSLKKMSEDHAQLFIQNNGLGHFNIRKLILKNQNNDPIFQSNSMKYVLAQRSYLLDLENIQPSALKNTTVHIETNQGENLVFDISE
mgnify:CR=1 FL=1